MGIGIHGPDGQNPRGVNVAAAASAAAATSSLEKALDEATDRYSVSPEVKRELVQLKAGLTGTAAMAMSAPRADALSRVPTRLRWRGREVSDEFQRYAERVASGEELAPYRGQVLARPCVESPWGVPEPPLPSPVRRSVVVGALLAASIWLVAVLSIAPRPPSSNPELLLPPNTAVYASPEAVSHLGALSLNDVEPFGDVAAGEVLAGDDAARPLPSGESSQGTTRAVSAHRRGARASSAAASVGAPEGALAAEAEAPLAAGEAPLAAAEVPALPPTTATDDFDWLLEGEEGEAAAPVDESAVTPPPPAAPEDPPPSPGSALLLERPTF